ncbi:hypothetical protein SMACR_08134 [Sordaria macrospora]|uniref:WGS project CABT00000000 data, contig 2.3 n=2 Tax=Sordaria macrospora TaxID=5147 RepID=F7VQ37_SORMK|nr:uncharacterized protein SMAC_08134 [Sordaria macrospora k-hell]KAA8628314.1 hypothetical protein SMACR_08134 [Sordaria macrospora]KAH7627213.1 hypothetical protein B0T09DRAFT_40879 [Sordaria sp. MPI-SDFR-AT-0083]WPJ65010.1 hypothetical protein SMAC4_08134 [Sordaria macrospora]CCC07615.1 unnamed protein product [Sordaria macrospora k-hell]
MLGKILLTIDSLFLLFATPAADYSETHIFNPAWKPHAKFHCGQTITISVVMGLATLFYTWFPSGRISKSGPVPIPAILAERRERMKESFRTAGFLGSVYWLAGVAAILYPNTAGTDPEFGKITDFPQGKLFPTLAALAILGAWLETRRLNRLQA